MRCVYLQFRNVKGLLARPIKVIISKPLYRELFMSDKNYIVYQGADGIWRGKKQS